MANWKDKLMALLKKIGGIFSRSNSRKAQILAALAGQDDLARRIQALEETVDAVKRVTAKKKV